MPPVDLSRATWTKSSYSTANGQCVEVAIVDGMAALRHSQDPDGAVLTFEAREWAAFLNGVRGGEFNLR